MPPNVYSRFNVPYSAPVEMGRSRTDPSFQEECDVNNIISRYKRTGLFPSAVREGLFEDFSESPEDLMTATARIRETERLFMSLPADIRAKFNGSYISLLQFLEDPANAQEARDMGLFRKEAPPEPGAPDSGTPPS